MDLISRKAAIEAIKELLYEPDSVQYIWSSDALSAVKHAQSVPAVPLDKLCEWLQENASLKSGTLISAVGWKYALIKWMEEEDAQKEN